MRTQGGETVCWRPTLWTYPLAQTTTTSQRAVSGVLTTSYDPSWWRGGARRLCLRTFDSHQSWCHVADTNFKFKAQPSLLNTMALDRGSDWTDRWRNCNCFLSSPCPFPFAHYFFCSSLSSCSSSSSFTHSGIKESCHKLKWNVNVYVVQEDDNFILPCLGSASHQCVEMWWMARDYWKPVKLHNTSVIKENLSPLSSENTGMCKMKRLTSACMGCARVCLYVWTALAPGFCQQRVSARYFFFFQTLETQQDLKGSTQRGFWQTQR